jgi:hypothetical protein
VLPDTRWFEAIIAAVERYEKTAAAMAGRYATAIEGMPMTERIETEMVVA